MINKYNKYGNSVELRKKRRIIVLKFVIFLIIYAIIVSYIIGLTNNKSFFKIIKGIIGYFFGIEKYLEDIKIGFIIRLSLKFIKIIMIPLIIGILLLFSSNSNDIRIYDKFLVQPGNKENNYLISVPIKSFANLYIDVIYKIEFSDENNISKNGVIYYKKSKTEKRPFLNRRKHLCISPDDNEIYSYLIDKISKGEKVYVRVFVNALNPITNFREVKLKEFKIDYDDIFILENGNFNINESVTPEKKETYFKYKNWSNLPFSLKFKVYFKYLSIKSNFYHNISNIDDCNVMSKNSEKRDFFEKLNSDDK